MTTTRYQVRGMTCEHCATAVTAEVSALAEVTDVQVEVASGQVEVTSNVPLDRAAVAAAVDEAGYELVGPG